MLAFADVRHRERSVDPDHLQYRSSHSSLLRDCWGEAGMTRQTGDSAIWRARRESPHRRDGVLRIDRCRDKAPGHATPRRVPAPGCSFPRRSAEGRASGRRRPWRRGRWRVKTAWRLYVGKRLCCHGHVVHRTRAGVRHSGEHIIGYLCKYLTFRLK